MAEANGIFALPPGADFAREFAAGLIARFAGKPPEALGRTTLFLNSGRMARAVTDALCDGGARLLPRMRLVAEIAGDPTLPLIGASVPDLRLRLELRRPVAAWLARRPDRGPGAAAYGFAAAMADLLAEIEGAGLDAGALRDLDVGDHAAHWQQNLQLLGILFGYLAEAGHAVTATGLQYRAARAQAERWAAAPTSDPVIVAGTTGSRAATRILMEAVARLPKGAVVLPGFDRHLPQAACAALAAGQRGAEDHPQFRLMSFLGACGCDPATVRPWHGAEARAPRNRFISLSLRPAPVTDQWIAERPGLVAELGAATEGLAFAEAPNAREEAALIAARIRSAVEDGERVTLITPDRRLTRAVAARLEHLGIVPDDSAGQPLARTPAALLVRLALEYDPAAPVSVALIDLCKHPLVGAAGDRGGHLLRVREAELDLRVQANGQAGTDWLRDWAAARAKDPEAAGWADWLAGALVPAPDEGDLAAYVNWLVARCEALSPCIWSGDDGAAVRAILTRLWEESEAGGPMRLAEFAAIFSRLLDAGELRNPVAGHPLVAFRGTIEARVESAGVTILGGLNDGIWPATPGADPWLSRPMRADAGLMSPERRIGLAAHDFQQAIAGADVLLTRALRDDDAPTVPSRWLARLIGLLGGCGADGRAALAAMRDRGAAWTAVGAALDGPATGLSPARRPAPCPPVPARPTRISATSVMTLIRDPYAIYARDILRLRPLDPLRPGADFLIRGTLFHDIMEAFISATRGAMPPDAEALLAAITSDVLDARAPWPVERSAWIARMRQLAPEFIADEVARRGGAGIAALEARGTLLMAGSGVTLSAKADRIDRLDDGRLAIYDYKAGTLPSPGQVDHFDRQLPIEAMVAEAGGFEGLGAAEVGKLGYISLKPGAKNREVDVALVPTTRDQVDRLLIGFTRRATAYASRRRVERGDFEGEYDHLARYGEWTTGDDAAPEAVG